MTTTEMQAQEQRWYARGVSRGEFEAARVSRFVEARELLERGASLFFGRNPDMSHMDTPDFRAAHLEWFKGVSEFLRSLDEPAALPKD